MAGNPRKPPRASGPRGKVRVAGSGPSTAKASPNTTAADATSVESSDETVSLDKAGPRRKAKSKSGKSAAQPAGPRDPAAAQPFLTWRKVAILAAVAVVIAVVAVIAAFKPGASTQSNMAYIDSSETSALKAQAGDRICAVLSIDPTKFDDWANNAKTGLTGQALTEFNEYQATSKDLAAKSGQGAECKIDLVAVSNMDSENATVVATLLISTTQQGVAVLSGPGQARTELGLQKVDGQWLISRISDF